MVRREYVHWDRWEGLPFTRRSNWLQNGSAAVSDIIAELWRRPFIRRRSSNGGYELIVKGCSELTNLPEWACRNATGLRVFREFADCELDCRTFARLPGLRSLSIGYASRIRYAGAINNLKKLNHLTIEDPIDEVINIDKLPCLQELAINYQPRFVGIANAAALRSLRLSGPPGPVLDTATIPTNITHLTLDNNDRLTGLGNLGRLASLVHLEIYGLKLSSLTGVEACLQMRRIIIENCNSLSAIDDIWSLPQLTYLEVRDCSSLKHVKLPYVNHNISHLFMTGRTKIDNCAALGASLPSLKYLIC